LVNAEVRRSEQKWVPAEQVDRLNDKVRASIETDVVSGWQQWAHDEGMTYAQPMLIATARK
jgi:hypothetical protein